MHYIGTIKGNVQTSVKEHERHCRLYQPEKTSIASHMLETGLKILFEENSLNLHTIMQYYTGNRQEFINMRTISPRKKKV